jgi:hypothetical protein
MSERDVREDVPPEPGDQTWPMGDPETERIEEPERTEEGMSRPVEQDWEENEPSPHQGEQGQEGSDA